MSATVIVPPKPKLFPIPVIVQEMRDIDLRAITTMGAAHSKAQGNKNPWSNALYVQNEVDKTRRFLFVARSKISIPGLFTQGCVLGLIYLKHVDNDDDTRTLYLLDILTHPDYRRRSIGRQMLEYVFSEIMGHSFYANVVANVRETKFITQIFLREMKFRAEKTKREFFSDTKEDCYVMVWRPKAIPPICLL